MQNHNGTWAPKKISKKFHALFAFHVLVPETHVPTFLKCEFEPIYPFFGCIITMEHGPHKQFPKNLTPSSRSMCRYPRHMSQLSLWVLHQLMFQFSNQLRSENSWVDLQYSKQKPKNTSATRAPTFLQNKNSEIPKSGVFYSSKNL